MSSNRHNNQLPNNLPQLQNVIKRDPEAYKEEFLQQFRHFQSTMEVFELSPDKFNSSLDELVMFLSQVAKCYGEEMKEFPDMIVGALRKHSTVIDPDMRLSFCRSLILLRNKSLISPAEVHQLFFELLSCQDKNLRSFLKDNIVNDIKNINAKHKDMKLNSTLQNFMYSMLRDSHAIAVKTSLQIMIALYQKNVWRDQKTVNVISTACFHKVTKVMVAALNFFLGSDEVEDDQDSDDDDIPTVKDVTMANKVNKKTRKRKKMLDNIKKAHKKKVNKEKAPSFNFSALHLIHDPQSLAERLFKKLETLKEKFEVKLLMVELTSRLIGVHELQVLNFYPYISRFLVPHQREVVKMLQYCAQAAHELVPPDAIEPVLKAIVNNFVTERNSSEVIAVGLNAIRELCARCPLVMDEDLLQDLSEYKNYKNKGVMMAGKSLILLFRQTHPELLHKKHRGRPTEAMVTDTQERRGFGEAKIYDYIPGAEVLDAVEETPEVEIEEPRGKKRKLADDEESDSDSSMDYDNIEEEKSDQMSLEEKVAKAKEVTLGRILNDEDFKRIDAALIRKQVIGVRKHKKQKVLDDIEDDIEELGGRKELVELKDIEMIHGAKKANKEERVATIMASREGREKFGRGAKTKLNEFASTSNKQKDKKKNFSMMKHKIKKKVKRSFRDKQLDLKKRLLKQQKFSGK